MNEEPDSTKNPFILIGAYIAGFFVLALTLAKGLPFVLALFAKRSGIYLVALFSGITGYAYRKIRNENIIGFLEGKGLKLTHRRRAAPFEGPWKLKTLIFMVYKIQALDGKDQEVEGWLSVGRYGISIDDFVLVLSENTNKQLQPTAKGGG